jgi:hypothetical protein
MSNISKERFIATNVLIAFEDGEVSFDTPRGATLADISEALDRIAKWHGGRPLSINVRLKAAKGSRCGCDRAYPLIPSPVS